MMSTENIFLVANILFTIGTALLIIKVIQNRVSLRDFDSMGSLITTVALAIMIVGYYDLKLFTSIVFCVPTLIFWAVVSIFSAKNIKRKVK